MNIIFEIKEKNGKNIYLSKERWKHIASEHPELANKIERIKETLTAPFLIIASKYDENVRYYYRYFKNKYLLVSVKYLNGNGFIITSFYVKNIRK